MIEAWVEWKERCALDLCSSETQHALRLFAYFRFDKYLSRYSGGRETAVPGNPWHLFETHMTTSSTQQGKRYKDWLFARVAHSDDPAIDVVQGGASMAMRSVARAYLRKECRANHTVSLDIPLPGASGATLVDVLASRLDPASEAALREYQCLAEEHAVALLPALPEPDRLVLLAKRLGVSLAHPVLVELADRSARSLNRQYHRIVERVGRYLFDLYGDEDSNSVLSLVLMTLQCLSEALCEEFQHVPAYRNLYLQAKDSYVATKVEFASRS